MFVDNVNNHIQHALALGYEAEFKMPEILFRNNLTEDQLSVLESDYHWDFIDNAIIYRPDGIELSYVVFWNGENYSCHTILINDKSVMNDDMGDKLSANCVTAFAGKLKLKHQFDKIADELKDKEKDWKGFITLDLILQDGLVYFKDIKFSIKEDYIYCLSALNNSDIDSLVERLEKKEKLIKPEGYACSMRLYSYPYDIQMNKYIVYPFLKHIDIDNNIKIEKISESFIILNKGLKVRDVWKNLIKSIPVNSNRYGVCYRTDGDRLARQAVNILRREHYID